VIDVDTAGRGPAAEDPAAFISHAATSALLAQGSTAERVWELADAAWRRWGSEIGVAQLCAIQLLGQAVSASDAGERTRAATLLRIGQAVLAGSVPSVGAGQSKPKDALMDSFERS